MASKVNWRKTAITFSCRLTCLYTFLFSCSKLEKNVKNSIYIMVLYFWYDKFENDEFESGILLQSKVSQSLSNSSFSNLSHQKYSIHITAINEVGLFENVRLLFSNKLLSGPHIIWHSFFVCSIKNMVQIFVVCTCHLLSSSISFHSALKIKNKKIVARLKS